jgi:hypothetical protein
MSCKLPLLFLPLLLTGCLTGKVIDTASTPDRRIKKDTLYSIKAAYVTDDRQLLVQIDSGFGDEAKHGEYNISIPLASHLDERRDQKVRITIPRSAVRPGWDLAPWNQSNPREITIAPPVALRSDGTYDFKTLGIQPGSNQTLYLVQKPLDYLNWELVFATHTPGFREVTYSIFKLKEESKTSGNGFAYLALIFTVPFDIATFPFQLAYKAVKGY